MRCLLCGLLVLSVIGVSAAETSDQHLAKISYSKSLLSRAESGSPRDEYLLGQTYATGAGVQQNEEQAVYWYRRAANHGDDNAINEMGRRYGEGIGVPRDDAQALLWFRRAAAMALQPLRTIWG